MADEKDPAEEAETPVTQTGDSTTGQPESTPQTESTRRQRNTMPKLRGVPSGIVSDPEAAAAAGAINDDELAVLKDATEPEPADRENTDLPPGPQGQGSTTKTISPPKKTDSDENAADRRARKREERKAQQRGDGEERTGPVEFIRQSIGELRKVTWPTGTQWRQYFVVVLIFVLIMMAIVSLLDLGFGSLALWLLGTGTS